MRLCANVVTHIPVRARTCADVFGVRWNKMLKIVLEHTVRAFIHPVIQLTCNSRHPKTDCMSDTPWAVT